MKKQIPNILTVSRIILVPVFMLVLMLGQVDSEATRLTAAALFVIISLTDMLDGKIARKYNYITEFGKFLDPLADKLLIFGAMLALIVFMRDDLTFTVLLSFAAFIILLREFAVTSLRMLFKGSGVIAANMAGKIKTVSQMVFIVAALIEPLLWEGLILTYLSMALMTFMTVYSGVNYFIIYLPEMKKKKE